MPVYKKEYGKMLEGEGCTRGQLAKFLVYNLIDIAFKAKQLSK